jgi:hypothetical protein
VEFRLLGLSLVERVPCRKLQHGSRDKRLLRARKARARDARK